MSKLPALTAEKLIKVLEKDGFVFIRQKGSHRFYEKFLNGERVVIPVPIHPGRELKKGTLHHILKKAQMSRDRLDYLLSLVIIS
ncbi:MAG: type II toxin-antitoxin system HicA family toxin [Candidatus Methanospirareceae archaeon]